MDRHSIKPIEELNRFNDELYREWRWGEKSKRKYIKIVNKINNLKQINQQHSSNY